MVGATLPDLEQLNAEALKALLISTHEQLLFQQSEIEHLKLLIAKLRRMQFGRKSEKLTRQIEQLELWLEDLEVKHSEKTIPSASKPAPAPSSQRPARRPLPDHLPRLTRTHLPKEQACPGCGGQLRKLGEDVMHSLASLYKSPTSFGRRPISLPKRTSGHARMQAVV